MSVISERKLCNPKRSRGTYSRLICLGCRDRRIRCELPREVEIPNPGELRTVQTPCYRCSRLGIPCIVRQTILGRPSLESNAAATSSAWTVSPGDSVSRVIIELPIRTVAHTRQAILPTQGFPARNGDTMLIHKPQSPEAVLIIHALDTLRCERVETEWFRYLPARVGHTPALDLSCKALVAACAYARGVPQIRTGDCYQALALALSAVQANMKQSHGELDDDMLASTALLAPLEGVVRKSGIPMRQHIEGLAAILSARSATYPVTQLARDIFDFYVCDSAVIACVHGAPSPFERMARAYFDNESAGHGDRDQAQLKALGSELFIRIPRLVGLVRLLQVQKPQQSQLLFEAVALCKSLLMLQDPQAEERLRKNIKVQPSNNLDAYSPLRHSLHFASVDDFEALTYYWQNRLWLLRLDQHVHDLTTPRTVQENDSDEAGPFFWPRFGPRNNEMFRLIKNVVMCADYARTLPLRKHERLFSQAMVIIWGIMTDMPEALNHLQDGEVTYALSRLLLRIVNVSLPVKPRFTAKDMDAAADMLVGGPPKGRYVELYSL